MDERQEKRGLSPLGVAIIGAVIAFLFVAALSANFTWLGPGETRKVAGIEVRNTGKGAGLLVRESFEWILRTEGPCPNQIDLDPGTKFSGARNATFMATVELIRQCRAKVLGYSPQDALDYAVFRVSYGVGMRYDGYVLVAQDLGARVLVSNQEYDQSWWKRDEIDIPPILALGP